MARRKTVDQIDPEGAVPAWRDRIVRHGHEPPAQILANPFNIKIHPRHQQDVLADVMQRVGWVQDVIVNEQTGHLIDGHLRVQMAISEGLPAVPVTYVDLGPDEEMLVLHTLDPIAALAAYDGAKIRENLPDLSATVGEPGSALATFLVDLAGQYPPQVNPFTEGADAVADEPISDADADAAPDDEVQVRTVTLYLTPEAHDRLLEQVSSLMTHLDLETIEDVIVRAVADSYEALATQEVT